MLAVGVLVTGVQVLADPRKSAVSTKLKAVADTGQVMATVPSGLWWILSRIVPMSGLNCPCGLTE